MEVRGYYAVKMEVRAYYAGVEMEVKMGVSWVWTVDVRQQRKFSVLRWDD